MSPETKYRIKEFKLLSKEIGEALISCFIRGFTMLAFGILVGGCIAAFAVYAPPWLVGTLGFILICLFFGWAFS